MPLGVDCLDDVLVCYLNHRLVHLVLRLRANAREHTDRCLKRGQPGSVHCSSATITVVSDAEQW